jgi:hypothetical protein
LAVSLAVCGAASSGDMAEAPNEAGAAATDAPSEGSGGMDYSGLFLAPPDPIDVQVALGDGAIKATIGSEGGVVEVATDDGLTHRLILPEGALVGPTEITITPIRALEGLNFEEGLTAGVQIEPHGLTLFQPATLILDLPDSVALDEIWGVSTLAGGDQAALHPIVSVGDAIEMPIFNFLTYNSFPGGRANAEDLADQPVTSAGRRVLGELAFIFAEDQQPGLDLSDLEWERIYTLLGTWLDEGILPLHEESMSDDIAFLRFNYELKLLRMLEAQMQSLGGGVRGSLCPSRQSRV